MSTQISSPDHVEPAGQDAQVREQRPTPSFYAVPEQIRAAVLRMGATEQVAFWAGFYIAAATGARTEPPQVTP